MLMMLYSILPIEDKVKFQSAWGIFGDIFPLFDMSSTISVALGKKKMMKVFINNPLEPCFQSNIMYSMESVYGFITGDKFMASDESDVLRIRYNVTKKCLLGCDISQEYKSRILAMFSCNKQINDPDEKTVTTLMNNFWGKR